ncbi:MAG TPA: phosphoribosylglycinamide formyltransferase [Terrimesophilobacter sp.]|nr:phosphoribosylglycinamide formyltransferase [Terrimesophilobacter sp.]
MLNAVVLISGGGSNLRALLDRTRGGDFPVRVVGVGADRDCAGLDHARAEGIPSFVVDYSGFASREAWADVLADEIRPFEPDVVVLSGLMRLLPDAFLAEFAPRVINTHPAYLPEFPGAHAVRDALAARVSETGASVIIVDDGIDSGPILARERVAIEPGDTEQSLHERIKLVERRLLEGVLLEFAAGHVRVEDSDIDDVSTAEKDAKEDHARP